VHGKFTKLSDVYCVIYLENYYLFNKWRHACPTFCNATT